MCSGLCFAGIGGPRNAAKITPCNRSHTRDFLLGVGGEGCVVVTCERRPVSGERAGAGGDDGLYGVGCGSCAQW